MFEYRRFSITWVKWILIASQWQFMMNFAQLLYTTHSCIYFKVTSNAAAILKSSSEVVNSIQFYFYVENAFLKYRISNEIMKQEIIYWG